MILRVSAWTVKPLVARACMMAGPIAPVISFGSVLDSGFSEWYHILTPATVTLRMMLQSSMFIALYGIHAGYEISA